MAGRIFSDSISISVGTEITSRSGRVSLNRFSTERKLREELKVEFPADFDFHGSYDETLFRGYIETAETATHIFKALRVDRSGGRYAKPQVLRGDTDNKLCCDVME